MNNKKIWSLAIAAGCAAGFEFFGNNRRIDLSMEKQRLPLHPHDRQAPTTSPWLRTASCKSIPADTSSQEFIADAVEVALPAVVSISSYKKFPFRGLQSSAGTGFIVDAKGYIITNEHVISDFREVAITLSDQQVLYGRVVAVDSKTDLALIKVEANSDLPVIVMGDDKDVRAGQWVVAIGNSLSFSNTVTAGIISHVNRDLLRDAQIVPPFGKNSKKVGGSNYIQTDAAINEGNSGGPLINLKGEVIAVNSLSIKGDIVQNINFSIPISEVKRFLREYGNGNNSKATERSPYALGIKGTTLNSDMVRFLRSQNRFPEGEVGGVFVHRVVHGSPAAAKGFKFGDVILRVDGTVVPSIDRLNRELSAKGGTVVTVTIYRPKVGIMNISVKPMPV